jgi:ribosomal protein L29
MKKKDLQLIRNKSLPELLSLVKSKRKELALSYVKIKSGKIKNTSVLKNLKREISQILTLIKEKEILNTLSGDKK